VVVERWDQLEAGAGGSRHAGNAGLGEVQVEVELGLDDLAREGLHVEEVTPTGEPGDLASDEVDRPRLEEQVVDGEHIARYGSLEELVDGFADAYNARDLDSLLELLAEDVELPGLGIDLEGFPVAVVAMWEERPNAVLTRGLLGEQPVTVLWDVGEAGTWSRVGLLTFELADDDGELGLVELLDDPSAVETAETDEPESDLPEGTRWEEWYEGEDGD
jgi:hypothetical protein